MSTATYADEALFEADEDAREDYRAYLADHDAYRAGGGILYADDYLTWLNHDRHGIAHRDRILAERDA